MNIVDIIINKRNGSVLSDEEIHFFVEGVKEATIEDYQISALLMAIFFRGMSDREIAVLTREMALSGDRLSFPGIKEKIVDKHSSGGVGDTSSLVLAPIVAACGLPIAKLSGRGLGFTGGTVDKLESIPGFKTEIEEDDFIRFVEKDGLSIIGQSADIAPVDKKLYALRDVTGTVDSIPLIAASIMSKKLADGSDAIVLDVKYGSGAFMKTPEEAIRLAETMVSIGENNGKNTIALITDMSQPLGLAVGNNLEVIEAIKALKGEGNQDFLELCFELAAEMLIAGDKAQTKAEARKMVEGVVEDGSALQKFMKMVENQGGDPAYIRDTGLFPKAEYRLEVLADRSGYISSINAEEIGMASLLLGAGRLKTSDKIDPAVGLHILKKRGDRVEKGEPLLRVFANDPDLGRQASDRALNAFSLSDEPVSTAISPIYARVSRDGVERIS